MSITKEDIFNELVKKRKNEVSNFDWKVQTSILLCKFFETKGYDFYFTPKLKSKEGGDELTPDFHAHKENKRDLLGEIKQSLSDPSGQDFDKIKEKDISQLKSYTQDLFKISTPHDVFFAAPQICDEAINKYIEKINSNAEIKDKIIVLKYYWSSGANHSRLSIDKIYGDFTDPDLNDPLKWKSYNMGEGDLEKIQGGYKILYTEEEINDTPIEYIMMIIWHNVLPELIKTSKLDKTLERIRMGENSFQFYVNDLKLVLGKFYTLKTSSDDSIEQFNKEMLLKSLKAFEKIGKAKCIEQNNNNPKYNVTFTKISKNRGELIDYLIRELNKEEFKKIAEIEHKRRVNKQI